MDKCRDEKHEVHEGNCVTCYMKVERCQVCNKPKDECDDWNDYYHACESCLK